MKIYNFAFEGTIEIEAENEDEAREKVDNLLGFDWWTYHNCKDVGIYNIELIEEYEEEDY